MISHSISKTHMSVTINGTGCTQCKHPSFPELHVPQEATGRRDTGQHVLHPVLLIITDTSRNRN